MATWEMTCSCGDAMKMDGDTAEQAADNLMTQVMTPSAMAGHMADKHPGQPVPTAEQAREGLVASARMA